MSLQPLNLGEMHGVEVRATAHATNRAAERGRLAGRDAIAQDVRQAEHLGAARDGLDALRGPSGLVYLVRLSGMLGRPPVFADVVTVLPWHEVEDCVRKIWTWGKAPHRWVRQSARVWPTSAEERAA